MPQIDREPRTVKEAREKWVNHIPEIYRNGYRKAMDEILEM